MSKANASPVAKFIPPQGDKSFSFQIVFPDRDLPSSHVFVGLMRSEGVVKAAHPYLQGHNGNWAMVEFWVKDAAIARRAAQKFADLFGVSMGDGDFTREELGL